jgi:hypothetical protein
MIERDKMESVLEDYPFFQNATEEERERMLDSGCAAASLHGSVVQGFTFANGRLGGEEQVRVGFVLRTEDGTKILVHVPYKEVLSEDNFLDVTNEGLPDCDDENIRIQNVDETDDRLVRGFGEYMQGECDHE